MAKGNHGALSFSRCRRQRVLVNFSGGSISSNGGALLLREVDRGLDLIARVTRALGSRRQLGKVRHGVVTMVRQRVHALALGYEDRNDHDALPGNPVVQTARERDHELANSSTLCRFEQREGWQWAVAVHQQLIEQFIASRRPAPQELVLDFDATGGKSRLFAEFRYGARTWNGGAAGGSSPESSTDPRGETPASS